MKTISYKTGNTFQKTCIKYHVTNTQLCTFTNILKIGAIVQVSSEALYVKMYCFNSCR